MKEKHSIDEFFKKGIEGHQVQPSDAVWAKIEAATQPQKKKKVAFILLLRAAVITILVGLSALVYFQNRPGNEVLNPDVIIQHQEGNIVHQDPTTTKGVSTSEPEKEKAKEPEKEPKSSKLKKTKTIPLMKQPMQKQMIYVEHIPEPSKEDEQDLIATEYGSKLNESYALNSPKAKSKAAPVRLKFKLSPAARPDYSGNKSSSEEGNESLRDKLYAYANTQFGNFKEGRPLELPKPEKKPQIEIGIPKIFTN